MVVSCINACGFGLSYNIFWLAFCSLLWWMLHYRLHCSCFTLFPSAHTSLFMFHCYFLQSTVHLIHFTYRSPSRSYLSYLVAFILHGHSTMLSVSLFSQSLGISDLRVSLDEFFYLGWIFISWSWVPVVLLLLVSLCCAGNTVAGGCLGLLTALLKYRGWCFVPWCFGMGGSAAVFGTRGFAGVFAAGVGRGGGGWFLVEFTRDSCWGQLAILGLVLLVTQLKYTKFIRNNRALFHLWWE